MDVAISATVYECIIEKAFFVERAMKVEVTLGGTDDIIINLPGIKIQPECGAIELDSIQALNEKLEGIEDLSLEDYFEFDPVQKQIVVKS